MSCEYLVSLVRLHNTVSDFEPYEGDIILDQSLAQKRVTGIAANTVILSDGSCAPAQSVVDLTILQQSVNILFIQYFLNPCLRSFIATVKRLIFQTKNYLK